MTLRRKTLLTIGLTLGLLIAIAYGMASLIFLARFTELETVQLRACVQRMQRVINDQLEHIESTARDYATQGDSFNFAAGLQPAYTQKYQDSSLFRNYDIDAMVVMPVHGDALFAKSVDMKTLHDTPLAERIAGLMANDSGLRYNAEATEGKNGILRVGTGFFLFAAHPILPASRKGPSNGTLLMTRELDADMLSQLSELTQLGLAINGVVGDLPADFAIAWKELHNGGSGPVLRILDNDTYAAYVPMLDQARKPVALLRATSNREIFTHARSSIYYLLIALLLLGVAFIVITLLSLERLVLARLARLTNEVNHIGMGGDLNARVTVTGRDELSVLAQKVNSLLNNLSSQIDLEHAVASAQTAASAKSTFLANMSHELRTPLNAIIGYSELLQESVGDEGLSRLVPDLQKIVEAGKHLQSIISNVLDISKIEAGKMELEHLPFDLYETINAVSDIMLVRSREKALPLLVSVDDGVPRHIVGDAPRLRQVLVNLLNNAVKFTDQGEVELTVGAKSLDPHDSATAPTWELTFNVRDTGIGIPAQRFERLFKAFSQVDASSSRKYGGTGLGLAISQQLCEMMGGRMWVESVEGTGSTFHLTLQTREAVKAAVGY
ncbi:MAG: HAMP domain-containing protein [Gammaproteobacteria bacterium]|nr:HAMP domain-containing protein [Gammaproteobacteria bacterium]